MFLWTNEGQDQIKLLKEAWKQNWDARYKLTRPSIVLNIGWNMVCPSNVPGFIMDVVPVPMDVLGAFHRISHQKWILGVIPVCSCLKLLSSTIDIVSYVMNVM